MRSAPQYGVHHIRAAEDCPTLTRPHYEKVGPPCGRIADSYKRHLAHT
jgi:hypothetical protein